MAPATNPLLGSASCPPAATSTAPPQVPLQVLTERALAQHYYSQNKATLQAQGRPPADAPELLAWDVSSSMYPHPTTDSINIGALAHMPAHLSTALHAAAWVPSRVHASKQRMHGACGMALPSGGIAQHDG